MNTIVVSESPRLKRIHTLEKEIAKLKQDLKTRHRPYEHELIKHELQACARELVRLHEDI